MARVVFNSYRDVNRASSYPFTDVATLTSINGDFTIPKEVFCDASIFIPGAIPPVYIQSITKTASQTAITVSDFSKRHTASGELDCMADEVKLYDNKNHFVGLLVAPTNFSFFTSIPYGEYEFSYKATTFAPRCVIAMKDTGVTSIGSMDEALDGSIWLCGKDGIIVRYVDGAIRFDVVGEPLFKQEDPNYVIPQYIQTINGSPSNQYGDFNIKLGSSEDILRINNSSEGITIYAAGI